MKTAFNLAAGFVFYLAAGALLLFANLCAVGAFLFEL